MNLCILQREHRACTALLEVGRSSWDWPIQLWSGSGVVLGITRNMGNRGADAPTGTSEPICLRQSIETSTASIRTSDGHPIGALGVCSAPNSAENLIGAIYILSIVMPHALVTLIRRGNATTKKSSVVGGSRNPIMLTSERRRIEDLNLTISYADSRRRLGPECQH